MMKKVTKAVIPAAGLGTRVLPATKAMPKGMLPIVDKPAIQYLVEEAVRSGITDILIILGRNQSIIEDHFDRSPELEEKLAKPGKEKALEECLGIANMANIFFVRQKQTLGLGPVSYTHLDVYKRQLQLLHALAGGIDGQSLFQVLDRLAIIGKLHLHFVNRDHSFSSSRNDNKVKSFILKRHSLYTDTSLVYRESVLK